MLQINPFLDCTIYSGIGVHIGRNSQKGIFILTNTQNYLHFILPMLKRNQVSFIGFCTREPIQLILLRDILKLLKRLLDNLTTRSH